MALDIGELTPMLDQETGFALSDAQLLDLLIVAVDTFNAWAIQTVGVTGTTFDRAISNREHRLIVLFALATYLRGKESVAAITAVIHTNVAGRTDLTEIPKHLRELRRTISDEIRGILDEIGGRVGVADIQVHELGATKLSTMASSLTTTTQWIYPS